MGEQALLAKVAEQELRLGCGCGARVDGAASGGRLGTAEPGQGEQRDGEEHGAREHAEGARAGETDHDAVGRHRGRLG